MKLLTFEVATPVGRFQRLGALLGEGDYILDLNAAYAWHLHDQGVTFSKRLADVVVPDMMRSFIEGGEKSLDEARKLVAFVSAEWNLTEAVRYKGENDENLIFHRSNVKLKTPLPNPNSLRDFLAFEAHTKKGYERRNQPMPQEWYELPVYYKGNHRSLIGPDEPVIWPQYTEKLDYELELACILGKPGKDIKESDATQHIFGFAVLNDWSARDIQMREMICRLGPAKGKDFASAIGPVIVTRDEIPDVRNLRMTAKINGELWSDGNTGTCHWTWEQMIAHVSQDEMLYASDILGSGTVGGGCGYELDRWIKAGDVVELEIECLGKLRNPIMTREQAQRNSSRSEGGHYAPAG